KSGKQGGSMKTKKTVVLCELRQLVDTLSEGLDGAARIARDNGEIGAATAFGVAAEEVRETFVPFLAKTEREGLPEGDSPLSAPTAYKVSPLQLLNRKEVAKLLGVSRETVKRREHTGMLPAIKLSSR